jgi:Bifunctional DNA primase/polymerase, N-terminal
MSLTLRDGALNLAELEYHVFPLRPRGKRPITEHGFKAATRDERQILKWWATMPDANVGIACGVSGINVLDIDAKGGADPTEVIAELGLESVPAVWTGEAPERSTEYPDSLAGERGAQVYFRGGAPDRSANHDQGRRASRRGRVCRGAAIGTSERR